ncbi:hypothetical protein TNCV_3100641 [Trichonephila clavipes]|nr:hypothetical protein TNCV_3100641 [Trichonephila clavipes]
MSRRDNFNPNNNNNNKCRYRCLIDKTEKSQNGGYGTQFVIKWAQVRIRHGCIFEKEVGLPPEMDSHLEWKAARPFCSMLGSLFVLLLLMPPKRQ